MHVGFVGVVHEVEAVFLATHAGFILIKEQIFVNT